MKTFNRIVTEIEIVKERNIYKVAYMNSEGVELDCFFVETKKEALEAAAEAKKNFNLK